MRIGLIVFISIFLLLLLSSCASRQGVRLASVPPPEGIASELEQFGFIVPVDELRLRSFRISSGDLPFDGEIISIVGRSTIYFRDILYPYWIWGNRLSFDLWIDTPYGRMVVDNMWEFGFGRAAGRHGGPIIWQEYQYSRIPIVDGISEEEARDLQYLFTITILGFGLQGFLTDTGTLGILVLAASLAYGIYFRINKRSAKKGQPKTLSYKLITTIYFGIMIPAILIQIGRLL
jgi:hypothetical protein